MGIFSKKRIVSLCGLILLLVAAGARAQTQNATIAGTVRDATGAVLPGVTVEASSPALIEKVRNAVTDGQGAFQIIELRAGTYTVTFTLPGFTTVRREGLQLTPNFIASLNVELRVGGLEETVTVSGQSPVVDVRTVVQQRTLNTDLLDRIPSGSKTPISLGNLVPAVIANPAFRDVGGSKGESSTRMAMHGGLASDQVLMTDGFRTNNMAQNGAGRGLFVNASFIEETVLTMGGGGSAEFPTGGIAVNSIPKSGSNSYSLLLNTLYTSNSLQAGNLTDALRARGARTASEVRYLYDVGGGFGGPLRKDKVWFYSSLRKWGDKIRAVNLSDNLTPHTLFYAADVSKPIDLWNWYQDASLRLTWQVSAKDKLAFTSDWQVDCQCQGVGVALAGTAAFEAGGGLIFNPAYLLGLSWSHPQSSRMLFEAGGAFMKSQYQSYTDYADIRDTDIAVTEQSRGFAYNRPTSTGQTDISQWNARASMSFLPSSHNIKIGFSNLAGWWTQRNERTPQMLSYTFNNQRPVSITLLARTFNNARLKAAPGFYAQDQWNLRRLTLTYGLRLDIVHSWAPAMDQPASRFLPARSFPEVDCVPCWKDMSPRFAASYDLFGTGRTALKAAYSRYVGAHTVQFAQPAEPVNAAVNSVTRSWNDANADFIPNCELTALTANGECGQVSNLAFGQLRPTLRFDPELVNGWQKRDYNWQASLVVDHELRPGIGLNLGYFRTWYGNFTVTDNLAVGPADYDQYCVTTPTNADLPTSGQQVCGLYNVSAAKFGQVDNLVTFAKKFGKQTNVYNGVDASIQARLPRRVVVQGGITLGNNVAFGSSGGANSVNRCFVVDSPQEMRFCDQPIPQLLQMKVFGIYPIAAGFEISGNFQSVAGSNYTATWNVPAAQVQNLGRPLAGNAATVPVELIQPWTQWEKRINQLDIRLVKSLSLGRGRLQAAVDLYNVFNAAPVLAQVVTFGTSWRVPQAILDARMLKFGATFTY